MVKAMLRVVRARRDRRADQGKQSEGREADSHQARGPGFRDSHEPRQQGRQ